MQGSPSHDLPPAANALADSATITGSQSDGVAPIVQHRSGKHVVKKSNQICRFYGTKKGCRAGDQCPFRHVQKPVSNAPVVSGNDDNVGRNEDGQSSKGDAVTAAATVKPRAPLPLTSVGSNSRAPVSKPVSSFQQRDPREFQIDQVVRRFSPVRVEGTDVTTLQLKLRPSDPDFPFELDALEYILTIPSSYPQNGKPSIRVENKDLPRGFQINVERGFDSLCSGSSKRTLLQLMNDLDRNLERYLTSEKAQTIKIIANRKKEEPVKIVTPSEESVGAGSQGISLPVPAQPTWTIEQKREAKSKRDAETRQLEARMSRVPLFSSSKDGIAFNVPLQIPKPSRLPLSLQSLKELTLIVPTLYGLEPCRIKLKGVAGTEADNVELAFEKRAIDNQESTLMAHINHLTHNIHTMAVPSAGTVSSALDNMPSSVETATQPAPKVENAAIESEDVIVDEDRPHLRFLSQPPPEWIRHATGEDESESELSDEYESEDVDTDASEGAQSTAGGASLPATAPASNLEKGVLLSFPHLELHGIELLELRDVSLSVKCDRCKDTLDIQNIKPAEPDSTSIRTESCNKCASSVSVSYRSEPMHINSIKAGYIDLEGCTIVDMLPSRFMPTCSECSTTYPTPGIVSVRGESSIAVCRECHHRLNFKIPEIKFLRVSSNDPRLNLPLRSKRRKENLGITAGMELPNRGRCKHYSKSYRWFRFSCCNRVYPCDRCHDEKEEHPNEHANRMLCGWCSREQNYRPEDCHFCGRSVIRKTGGGFWEGGKGTRDRVKMNRNDPRKYKRIGGGAKAGEK